MRFNVGKLKRPDVVIAIAYLAVSAPIVSELLRKWSSDWYPTADDAVVAIQAHDVFSLHTPLVGLHSQVSTAARDVYHLGPMLFWSLAVPERVFSERLGIVVGAALVNLVAGFAIVRSVRRSLGLMPALAAAGVTSLMLWSVGRATLAEPWNPEAAVARDSTPR